MTLIKREQVAQPALRKEAVTVEALGGDVVVRELLLSERLAMRARAQEAEGDDVQGMVRLLAYAVVDADGLPIFTQAQWDVFGAQHADAVNELFGKALTLSGYDGEAARKN
ncbi:MAG: hypothetical protein ABI605_10875 [Rhizobacter sp.]